MYFKTNFDYISRDFKEIQIFWLFFFSVKKYSEIKKNLNAFLLLL